jgi:hypothetical protein
MVWQLLALAFFGVISGSGLYASMLNAQMLVRLNATLPENQRFALLGWHVIKTLDFHRAYKRKFGADDLVQKLRITTVVMFSAGLAVILVDTFFL